MKRKVIRTGDGSNTLEITDLNETYHSRHGALVEAKHVFIEAGLIHWLSQNPKSQSLSIFEMGLGTGMNALLTFDYLEHSAVSLSYLGLEAFPLESKEWLAMNAEGWGNYPQYLKLHEAEWNKEIELAPNKTIHKVDQTFESFDSHSNFDLIYYDAFGARAQPELWEARWFEKCAKMLSEGGVFVTYAAKGSVRRALEAADLLVERLPGPPGKREMLRATKTTRL